MIHSDSDVAHYYYSKELDLTNMIKNILLNNGLEDNHLEEKVHIMLGMIENLCHEVIYHKHKDINNNHFIIASRAYLLQEREREGGRRERERAGRFFFFFLCFFINLAKIQTFLLFYGNIAI